MKFAPLVGGLIGLAGGLIYWLALQVWPASVAVILATLAATTLLELFLWKRLGIWPPCR